LILFPKNTGNRLSDEELIREYRSEKDPEILGTLYQRYIHLVYGVCLKYLKNREESKDTVMQLFEKLMVEIDRHEVQHFRSWLYVMTKNFCFRKLQNEGSDLRKFRKYSEEHFMESTVEMSPLDEEKPGDLKEALKQCIEKLKREQKECIVLFYYNEKCYQEISDKLKLPLGKVKSFIQNGKRNLKICLKKQNETE
jgi:RNA polymerase sigma-70 factor (ECF subfamily)